MAQIIRIPLEKGGRSQSPQRIVVHCMGEFIKDNDQDYFAVDFLKKIGLSAHAFITPGGQIIRSRDDDQGAYHAKGFNTNSLGVEFLVAGLHNLESLNAAIGEPYLTDEQYQAGIELVSGWRSEYAIDTIDRHSDLSPDRKTDPGDGFPWQQFLEECGFEGERGNG